MFCRFFCTNYFRCKLKQISQEITDYTNTQMDDVRPLGNHQRYISFLNRKYK